jgi:hypothetical protein
VVRVLTALHDQIDFRRFSSQFSNTGVLINNCFSDNICKESDNTLMCQYTFLEGLSDLDKICILVVVEAMIGRFLRFHANFAHLRAAHNENTAPQTMGV